MGKDIDHGKLHDRGQPQRLSSVVAKDQKTGTEGTQFGQCEPIQDSSHGMLSDSKMKIPCTEGIATDFASGHFFMLSFLMYASPTRHEGGFLGS
jgi:hypothetical protein